MGKRGCWYRCKFRTAVKQIHLRWIKMRLSNSKLRGRISKVLDRTLLFPIRLMTAKLPFPAWEHDAGVPLTQLRLLFRKSTPLLLLPSLLKPLSCGLEACFLAHFLLLERLLSTLYSTPGFYMSGLELDI